MSRNIIYELQEGKFSFYNFYLLMLDTSQSRAPKNLVKS